MNNDLLGLQDHLSHHADLSCLQRKYGCRYPYFLLQTGYSKETVKEKLKTAREKRNRLLLEKNENDEEELPYEEPIPDHWDYTDIL